MVIEEGYFYFNDYIKVRIQKNKNFLACITGPTGSGKTYSSLKLAEDLDPNFCGDRVVFTPKEFVNLLNHGNLKTGSVIVFDEAGVSLNNREWQSKSNNLIQYILQTFRHKNYIVLFTSPDFSFIDKASRKLFHCYMETNGINFKEKFCRIKPLFIQINQRSGDMYFKYLQLKEKGNGTIKIGGMNIKLPSKKLIKDYEIKKTNFTRELNERVEADFKGDKQDKKTLRIKELEDKQMNIVTSMRANGVLWRDIAETFSENMYNLKRRYYYWEEKKQDTVMN